MAQFYPERAVRSPWQDIGQAFTQGGAIVGKLDDDLTEEEKQQNLLQDMVARRTASALEQDRLAREETRKQAEFDMKAKEGKDKDVVQSDLSKAMTQGVPAGEYPTSLVEGRPDPMMGLNPNEPRTQVMRPANQDDILGIAARGMDPYQTAALSGKPYAAEAAHDYKMGEIGARGENSRSVAQIRAAAMERSAKIRSTYSRGSGTATLDYKATMDDASANLLDVESDIADLQSKKPARAWDMQPWNTEMARLAGQQKFYQSQIYKANQHGVPMPGDDGDGADSEGDGDVDPGVPTTQPTRSPAPAPASRQPLNPAIVSQAKAKFGRDKNAAKAWLQSQGYDVQ